MDGANKFCIINLYKRQLSACIQFPACVYPSKCENASKAIATWLEKKKKTKNNNKKYIPQEFKWW